MLRIVEFAPGASAAPSTLDRRAAARGLYVEEVRRFDTLFNGAAVAVDAARADELAAMPGVLRVYPVNTYAAPDASVLPPLPHQVTRENATVTDLTGVPEAHRDGATGEGVKVGVIDSGIDYTHPALGGGSFPNGKVVGGYDVVDQDADPMDADSLASGHGTHVAGIIAGEDGNMVGVAPGADLYAYRVFGESRPTTDDVILEALERALEDGVDVVNLSLGQAHQDVRQDALLPRALDAVAAHGVIPVVAIGNGYAGPFSPGTPAIAKDAITVGSVYSTESTNLAFTVDGAAVPFNVFSTGPASPSAGTVSVVDGGELCAPPAPGAFRGKVVLATSGWYPCTPAKAAVNAQAGEAAAMIWYDGGEWADPEELPVATFYGDKTTVPSVAIRNRDGAALRARLAAGEAVSVTWGSYWTVPLNGEWAGTPDQLSSWGPSHELDYKPDVVAPGGYVFSTVPARQGHYAVMSGTSMATPHVSGAVALLLAERGPTGVAEMRDLLQSTAKPTRLGGDPDRGRHQVAQQGAGLIDVPAALASSTKVSPAKLPLGELEGKAVTRTVTLTNTAASAVQYAVGLETALGAAPPYTSAYLTVEADADVTVSANKVTVPPGKASSVKVTIRQPANVPDGTVFGGWVVFTPKHGGEVLRASYMGISGDWHAVSAINPTFTDINGGLDNPALRPAYFSFGKNEAITVTEAGKSAWVMLSHGFPTLRELRMEAVDANGNTVAVPVRREWVVRNSGAGTGMDFLEWDLTLADGSPAPNGTYRLRLVFDKILATGAPETWTSAEITIAR